MAAQRFIIRRQQSEKGCYTQAGRGEVGVSIWLRISVP